MQQLLISKDTLNIIGSYILNGMSEQESCILADVHYPDLQAQKEISEVTRNYLEKKRTEFKFNHLKEIQKSKSEKNSQWMLEKIFPEEFGSKPRSQEGPTVNIISAIIQDIQNDNGNNIVRFNRQARESSQDDQPRIIEGSSLLN